MAMTLTVIADFTASTVARYLAVHPAMSGVAVREGGYGQVIGALSEFERASEGEHLLFVWARAEGVIPSFRRALDMETVNVEDVLAEVDFYADAVLGRAGDVSHAFVTAFTLPPDESGYGLLDWRADLGLGHLIARMNLRLAERLAPASNVFVLDPARWMQTTATPSVPKLWYAAKVPYSNAVFQRAAADIVSAINAVHGLSRRLVILDLDNTLWGGVIGETGWQGIRLGGHDHVGEAYRAFQLALKALTRRGVQLAIVSKNEEEVALAALDQHPDMALRREDIAGWRINWQDKGQNVLDLLAELNLGAASAVFIDDNPVERDRVRTALPQVLVPEWPDDPCLYVQALQRLQCFDTATVSDEDRGRTRMYTADRARRALQGGSMTEWLAQLGTRVLVDPVSSANIMRVEQLFNKTNQLNLSTRRLTADQLLSWGAAPHRTLLGFSVSDKFGDLGLTGIVGVEMEGETARLSDYLLSCRVMGRRVEETLLHVAVEWATRAGAQRFVATYRPTERNAPTLKVFRGAGLQEVEPFEFSWTCSEPFPLPDTVALEWRG